MSGQLEYTLLGSGSSAGVPRADGAWGACVARESLGLLCAPGGVLRGVGGPVVVLDAGSPDVVPAGTAAGDVGGEADPLVPPAHLACLTPGDAQGRTRDELAVACFGSVDALPTAVHAGVAVPYKHPTLPTLVRVTFPIVRRRLYTSRFARTFRSPPVYDTLDFVIAITSTLHTDIGPDIRRGLVCSCPGR